MRRLINRPNPSRARLAIVGTVCTLLLSVTHIADAQVYRVIPGVRIRAMAANAANEVGGIASALQLSNGMYVIADNVNDQLHFYSPGGRFIRTVGRDGAGPGEFRSVRWVGECGRDSVYAFDYMQNRISVFTVDGKVARTFATPTSSTGYVRCTTDGTMLYVARGSMQGTASRGAFQISDNTRRLLYRSPDILLDEGRPLGRSIKIAIAPEGVAYGSGDSAVVTVMSVRGETPRRIVAGIAKRAPTDANRTAAIEYWSKVVRGTESDHERMRGLLRTLPPVTALPAYTDVFIDVVTKAIWIRTSTFGDLSTILERRGMDGALQGTATLPAGLEIQQIRGDVVLAMLADAKTGEEMLVSYRLAK